MYADDYLTSLSHSGGDGATTYGFTGVAGLSTTVKIGETWTLCRTTTIPAHGRWRSGSRQRAVGWKHDYDAQTDDLLRRYGHSDNTGFGIRLYHDSRGQISKIRKISRSKTARYGRNARDGRNTTAMTPCCLTRIVVTDGTNLISDIAWSYDADTECRSRYNA